MSTEIDAGIIFALLRPRWDDAGESHRTEPHWKRDGDVGSDVRHLLDELLRRARPIVGRAPSGAMQ